jgi:hypothetical protein
MRVQMVESHVVAMRVARCTVFFACKFRSTTTAFLVLLWSKWALRPCLWMYGAQREANSATFFPPWFGLFRHKQARPRINKIKSQRNCKQRGVKRSSCFITRKECTAQIHPVQVDDRLSAAHPTLLTMTHTKSTSASSLHKTGSPGGTNTPTFW